jgi:PII-like signaling protein
MRGLSDTRNGEALMLAPGLAKNVTIHVNEDTTARHDFLYNEIFSFLRERGVAGATLIRPAAGFGSHHRAHSTEGGLAEKGHLPVRIEFIETKDAADALLPSLCELITDGLIEAHETTVIKAEVREEPS